MLCWGTPAYPVLSPDTMQCTICNLCLLQSLFYTLFIKILILSNFYPNPLNIQSLCQCQVQQIPILSLVYPNLEFIQHLSMSMKYPSIVQVLLQVWLNDSVLYLIFVPSLYFVQSLSGVWIQSLSKVYRNFI